MAQLDETGVQALLADNVAVALIEPHIYAVPTDVEIKSSYDTGFGDIYASVACNPIYNRIVWGYATAKFASLADDALRSSPTGFVLDLGCGSLAFTAKAYLGFAQRPVVLLDQSLKLLRLAKARLTKPNGKMPANMVFLLGDALHLPFKPGTFQTIISLNLLHVVDDINTLLAGMKNVLTGDGRLYVTTLIKGGRLADTYLKIWESAGAVVARDVAQLQEAFRRLHLPIVCDVKGNMAFVRYGG